MTERIGRINWRVWGFIFLAFFSWLGMLFAAGCATAGPSSMTDGNRAETRFAVGSNMVLGADGDWSSSSPQQTATTGLYQTDESQSQISPGNGSGVRANRYGWALTTGGDVKLTGALTFAFNDEGEAQVASADWELSIDSGALYDYATSIGPVQQAMFIAGSDASTQQKIAQLNALIESVPSLSETARAVIEGVIASLAPGGGGP